MRRGPAVWMRRVELDSRVFCRSGGISCHFCPSWHQKFCDLVPEITWNSKSFIPDKETPRLLILSLVSLVSVKISLFTSQTSTIQGRIKSRTLILLNHEMFHQTLRNLVFISVYFSFFFKFELAERDSGSDVQLVLGFYFNMKLCRWCETHFSARALIPKHSFFL